jgi:hypothetical protein
MLAKARLSPQNLRLLKIIKVPQAWHTAEALPSALPVVLGDSIDLLVWIPKKDSPSTTNHNEIPL